MDNSGPAFPRDLYDYQPGTGAQVVREQLPGLTKRELFVVFAPAQEIDAMTPVDIKGCSAMLGMKQGEYDPPKHWPMVLAKLRCVWADAMIAELSKDQ